MKAYMRRNKTTKTEKAVASKKDKPKPTKKPAKKSTRGKSQDKGKGLASPARAKASDKSKAASTSDTRKKTTYKGNKWDKINPTFDLLISRLKKSYSEESIAGILNKVIKLRSEIFQQLSSAN